MSMSASNVFQSLDFNGTTAPSPKYLSAILPLVCSRKSLHDLSKAYRWVQRLTSCTSQKRLLLRSLYPFFEVK